MVAFNSSFSSEISHLQQVLTDESLIDPVTEKILSTLQSIEFPFTRDRVILIVKNLRSLQAAVKVSPNPTDTVITLINKTINRQKFTCFAETFHSNPDELIKFIEQNPSILLEIDHGEPRWFALLKSFIEKQRESDCFSENRSLSKLITCVKAAVPQEELESEINGKTLLDHALDNKDHSFLILLIENKFKVKEFTPDIVEIIKKTLKSLKNFYFSDASKLKRILIEQLIESKTLPFLCLKIFGTKLSKYLQSKFSTDFESKTRSGNILDFTALKESRQVSKILRDGPADLRAFLIDKWSLNAEMISLLLKIDTVVESLIVLGPDVGGENLSLFEIFEIVEELDQSISAIREIGFSQCDRLEQELSHLKNYLMPYLQARKDHSETQLEGFSINDDEPLFLFLLDKAVEFVPEGTKALNCSRNELRFLLDAANKAHLQSQEEKGSDHPMSQFLLELSSILQMGRTLTDNFNRWGEKTTEFIQVAKDAAVGFPVFAGTGISTHNIVFSLEKNENGTYKITLFNTGLGVNVFHYASPNRFKFQTFLSIDQVSPNDALDPSYIRKMLEGGNYFANVDQVYATFKEWGKEGIMLPASSETQDYEQVQAQGTCSAQAYMAFLRYFSMSWIKKSGLEKLGFYKEVKARILAQLAEPKLTRLQPLIRRATEIKLTKYYHELELLQMVNDPEKYALAREYLQRLLEITPIGEKKEILLAEPGETPHERLAVTRALIREISYRCTEEDLILFENVERNEQAPTLLKMIQYRYQYKTYSEKTALVKIQTLCHAKNYKKALKIIRTFIGLSSLVSPFIRKWTKERLEADVEFFEGLKVLSGGSKLITALLGEKFLEIPKP